MIELIYCKKRLQLGEISAIDAGRATKGNHIVELFITRNMDTDNISKQILLTSFSLGNIVTITKIKRMY